MYKCNDDSDVNPTGNINLTEPVLELDEIQGNSVLGFSKPCQNFIFFTIKNLRDSKNWLKLIIPKVTTTQQVLNYRKLIRESRQTEKSAAPEIPDSVWLHLSFSSRGIRLLGDGFLWLPGLSFNQGIDGRNIFSFDQHYQNLSGLDKTGDFLAILASDRQDDLDIATDVLIKSAAEYALEAINIRKANTFPGEMAAFEHFGYRDGISQPGIKGYTSPQKDEFLMPRLSSSQLHLTKDGNSVVNPGEFILGYPSESGFSKNNFPDSARNGSFLSYVRFLQDVEAFKRITEEISHKIRQIGEEFRHFTPDFVGARLIGRWSGGAPLVKSPKFDDPALAKDNDFDFSDNEETGSDALGEKCPFRAHIRKTAPRDELFNDGKPPESQKHRILRRGLPFGERYPAQNERGLLFVGYQASIEQQFEFIMKNWVNNSDFPRTGAGADAVIGNLGSIERELKFTIETNSGRKITVTANFEKKLVTPTEGGYFFSPSISALQKLAG